MVSQKLNLTDIIGVIWRRISVNEISNNFIKSLYFQNKHKHLHFVIDVGINL